MAPVLEFCRMCNTPLLQLLPGPLKLKLVICIRVSSMYQIEFFNHLLRIIISYLKLDLMVGWLVG